MKVACEGCGAKYAIPEDKIQGAGRTFKITCRQCGAPIVIKGIGDGSESKWYFAVGRDRQGPVSATDLAKKVEEGSLTLESLAWCQGMDGWVAISQISALASALGAGGDAELEGAEDISDDTTMVSKSDIEAAHAEMSQLEPAPSAETPTSSSFEDLFAGAAPLDASAPKHERADTSVLFSLDDLAKSTNNPLPGVNFSSAQNSEQSGLLDVTAAKPRSGNRRRPMTQSPFDDAPAPISRPVESNTNTIAVPVIKRRSNALPIAIGALVLIGGGAFAAMQLMGGDPPPAPKAAVVQAAKPESPAPQSASKAPAPKASPAAPTQTGAAAPAAAKTNAAPAAAKTNAAPENKEAPNAAKVKEKQAEMSEEEKKKQRRLDKRERRREAQRSKGSSEGTKSSKSPAKAEAPKAATAPPKPAPKAQPTPPAAKAPPAGPKKDVNALLASLNKDKSKESAAGAGANAGNLPQRLSSSKLRSTLRRKKGAFNACYKKMAERPAGGITVNTSLIVAGSGSVKSVRITSGGGASAGVLRCITSALKSTKFPAFASAQMSVNYPITLR